jgi:hypothetical protein
VSQASTVKSVRPTNRQPASRPPIHQTLRHSVQGNKKWRDTYQPHCPGNHKVPGTRCHKPPPSTLSGQPTAKQSPGHQSTNPSTSSGQATANQSPGHQTTNPSTPSAQPTADQPQDNQSTKPVNSVWPINHQPASRPPIHQPVLSVRPTNRQPASRQPINQTRQLRLANQPPTSLQTTNPPNPSTSSGQPTANQSPDH